MAASGRLQQFEQYRKVITNGKWYGTTALVPHILEQPLHWRKPRMIFVSSMGDLFHESVPFEWIDRVMAVVSNCSGIWPKYNYPTHIFQILTKRIERAFDYFNRNEIDQCAIDTYYNNLWLGVTCENQKCADQRIPTLLQIPAAVRFLSLEPLLEDIDIDEAIDGRWFWDGKYLAHIDKDIPDGKSVKVNQVIIGCESGPGRRPCKLEWVRNIVAQCRAAGVAVFVKQLSINGKVEHDIEKFPIDLRIREYPEK